MITLTGSDPLTQAMRLASERGLLPTALGSAEIQELTQRLKERVFLSARTSNLWYLDKLKALTERFIKGEGRDNDLAQLRIEARKLLAQAGYTPESGFPGDEALGIPPATAGSLRDLGSEKRLNLIFDTQAQMMRGLGMKLRGHDRSDRWPAWELVRVAKFSSEHQREWLKRWKIAADNLDDGSAETLVRSDGRMVALKSSPVWFAIGSSALFPDALNQDHPPFAFHSGMGWREVPLEEAQELGLISAADPRPGYTTADVIDEWLYRKSRPFEEWRNFKKMKPVNTPADPADAAKLERFKKLQAKFQQIDAARR
jgi:hypothetical protein